ncbi:MAG: dephospho-CoA kinase [Pseudobdellovibrionaceae bacterium]
MKWIGITGGIATGKSTLTRKLRALGYDVLDADEISQRVTGPGGAALPEIFKTFGDQVKAKDGSLDRKALAALVFGREHGQERGREQLEAIIHPLVQREVAAEKLKLEKQGKAVAFYDVPLLYEKKLENNFDDVIVVAAAEDLQLQRLRSRNQLTEAEAQERLRSQIPIQEKVKKTKYVIHNTQDLDFLEKSLLQVLRDLKVL